MMSSVENSMEPRGRPRKQQTPRNRSRRFGTLLSANSPTPRRKASQRRPEETIVFDSNATKTKTITVHFDQGPIGLQLQPVGSNCVVQKCVTDGAAERSGKIQPGDIVVAVNDQHPIDYDTALQLLQTTRFRRSITFQRIQQQQPESPTTSMVTVPLHDDDADSLQPQVRSSSKRKKKERTPNKQQQNHLHHHHHSSSLDSIRRRVVAGSSERSSLHHQEQHMIPAAVQEQDKDLLYQQQQSQWYAKELAQLRRASLEEKYRYLVRINELEDIVDRTGAVLQSKDTTLQTQQDNLTGIQGELEQVRHDYTVSQCTVRELQAKTEQMKDSSAATVRGLEGNIRDMQAKEEQLNRQVQRLNSRLDTSRVAIQHGVLQELQHRALAYTTSRELARMKQDRTQLEDRIHQANGTVQLQTQELAACRSDRDAAQRASARNDALHRSAVVQHLVATVRVKEVTNTCRKLTSTNERLQCLLEEKETDLNALSKNLLQARSETKEALATVAGCHGRMQEMEAELQTSREKLAATNLLLLSKDQSNNDLKTKVDATENKYSTLKEHNKRLTASNASLKTDLHAATDRLREAEESFRMERSAFQALKIEHCNLQTEAQRTEANLTWDQETLRAEVSRANVEYQQLQDEFTKVSNQLAAATNNASSATSRNDELVAELQRVKSSLEAAERSIGAQSSQLVTLKDSMAMREQTFARRLALKDECIEQSKETVERVRGCVKQKQDECDELTRQLNIANDANMLTEKELTKFKQERDDAVSSSKSTESELRIQIRTSALENNALRERLDATVQHLAEAKSEARSKAEENQSLRDEVKRAQSMLLEANSKLLSAQRGAREASEHFETERRSLQQKLDQLSAEHVSQMSAAKGDLSDLKTEIRLLEVGACNAKKGNSELKAEVRELNNAVCDLRSSLKQKDAELSQVVSDNSGLNLVVESTKKKNREQKEEILSLTTSLRLKQEEVSELESRWKSASAELHRANESMVLDMITKDKEIAALATAKDEAETETRSMSIRVHEIEVEMKDSKTQFLGEKKRLETRLQINRKEFQALETKAELLQREVVKYSHLAEGKDEECRSLKCSQTSLATANEELINELNTIRCNSLETENEHKREKDQFLLSLKALSEKNAALCDEIDVLRGKLETSNSEFETIERRRNEEMKLMKLDTNIKERAFHDLSDHQAAVNKELLQCKIEVKRLTSDIECAKQSAEQAEDRHRRGVAKLRADHNKALQDASMKYDKQLEKQIQDNAALKVKIEGFQKERDDLSRCVVKYEHHMTEFELELKHLRTTNEELECRLRDSSDTIAELRADLEAQPTSQDDDSGSFGSPFKGMTKYQLKAKCLEFESELGESEDRAGAATVGAERRSEHVKKLVEDLELMSQEMDGLIATNEGLESKLKDAWSQQRSTVSLWKTEQKRVKTLQEHSLSIEKTLEQLANEKSELLEYQRELQSKYESDASVLRSRTQKLEDALSEKDETLRTMQESKRNVDEALLKTRSEVDTTHSKLLVATKQVSQVTHENASLTRQLNEGETRFANLSSKFEEIEIELSKLAEERLCLKEEVTIKAAEVVTAKRQLEEKEQAEKELLQEIKTQRKHTDDSIGVRTETVAKLTDASRVVSLQQATIQNLEKERSELLKQIASFETDALAMRTKIDDLERASEEKTVLFNRQHESLEKQSVSLEDMLETSRKEARELREKLSDTSRSSLSQKQTVESLKAKIHTLKETLDGFRSQVSGWREKYETTRTSYTNLEAELDGKNMEVDHLKAKVQLLVASTSRLKSELLVKKTVTALSGQVREDSQISGELLRFVELAFDRAERSVAKLFYESTCSFGYCSGPSHVMANVVALDLAGLEARGRNSISFSETLEDLRLFLSQTRSRLEDQKQMLVHSNENQDLNAAVHDPTNSRIESPDMKLGIAAVRVRRPFDHSENADTDQVSDLRQVIGRLESQLDELVDDLRETNFALKEKDRILLDLKRLLETQEAARESLQRKIRDLESSSEEKSRGKPTDALVAECKRCASRLLLNTIQGRETAAKAVAFRQWACQVSAMSALSKHGQSADVLSHQLHETREKLRILKRHLRKTRRGTKDTSLDCIAEFDGEAQNQE